MQCFLCKKDYFKKAYSLKKKDILCCKNDGLFIAQQIKKDKTYGVEYFSNGPNQFNQFYFQKKLELIKLTTDNRMPKILDIGCGWGDFEEVLEKEKTSYLGIDINKEAIAICRKKGLNCQIKDLNQWNNESMKKSFDAITLFQVIEHLENPLRLLKAAKKLLKPNGIILITTPNNDSPLRKIIGPKWSVYSEPSHCIFFNKKTLSKTLEIAGFNNIEVKIDSPRLLSLSYIFSRLNFPVSRFRPLTSFIPVPTDPFGDLEATGFVVS